MSILKSAVKVGMKGMDIASPIISYNENRNEGHGVTYSVGSALAEYALYSPLTGNLGLALMAKDIAVGTFKFVNGVGLENAKVTSQAYKHQFGGNFQDSDNAYTMRQRGIQAIQNNGLNTRSVLGSEARRYFRGSL